MITTRNWSRSLLCLTIFLSFLATGRSYERRHALRTTTYDFGSCPNPGITWDFNLYGSEEFGFAPTDENAFPYGFSFAISSIEAYICGRLETYCGAAASAVQACIDAFELYSGLSGQNAADSWNQALGLYGSMPTQMPTNYGTTATAVATVLVSGNNEPYSTISSSISTSSLEWTSPAVFPGYTSPTYTVFSTETLTVDSSTGQVAPAGSTLASTVILTTSASRGSESGATSIIVPTGGTTVKTTASTTSPATSQPTGVATGTGDGGGSPFSNDGMGCEPLSGLLASCFAILAGLVLFL